tara:strand:- start:478 stop:666 length:189 start_codon:yes stop_codon:yes gene_type:complete
MQGVHVIMFYINTFFVSLLASADVASHELMAWSFLHFLNENMHEMVSILKCMLCKSEEECTV